MVAIASGSPSVRLNLVFCKWVASLTAVLVLAGCNGSTPTEGEKVAPVESAATKAAAAPVAEAPVGPPKIKAEELLTAAEQQLAGRKVPESQKLLAELRAAEKDLSAPEIERLTALEKQATALRETLDDEKREATLKQVETLIGEGNLEDAGRDLAAMLATGPSNEQRQKSRELQDKIEQHRKLQRKLRDGIDLLGDADRGRIKAGQTMLWEEPEVALPMLIQALKSKNPVLVTNSLEMLRKLNQPERTLPAMVGVLSRPEQAESWPATIKEIQRVPQGGAGAPLLALALSAKSPEQSIAALQALDGLVDPPTETIVSLLPRIYGDGPELAAALTAAYHSLVVHHQNDLVARRGLDITLAPEQDEQLIGLTTRLQEIIDKGPADSPAVLAAKRLAVATRQMDPAPFPGVKLVRATNELPESPASAALDGIWNSVELPSIWRHPSKALTTIVLDLGEERTVCGIRVWNDNEPAGMHRGWKDVEIYVSNSQSPSSPVAVGIIPQAPGVAGTPDYGATLQVPFARGRFVKLQMMSVWRDDGTAGLAEIQILGY